MGKIDNVVLVAVGSFIAGLLLAPKSGKETRQDIIDKTHELKGKASDSLREVKKGASSVKDEIADSFESVKAKAQQTADDVKRGRS
jgi:gas vesicle protein